MTTTIKDVALASGVSIKTVSRVLNNERYVGPSTREKVHRAVAELNFRPNHAARSLAGRRSFQVALVCDNPSPAYVYAMQQGIRDRCETDGVRVLAQPYDRGSPRLLADLDSLIATSGPDGVILTPPLSDNDAVLALLAARGIHFARVSPGTRPGLAPSTFIDNVSAARELTTHLIARGHRRIAHIAGSSDYATSAQRVAGYEAALDEAGIATDPTFIISGRYDFASGAEAADLLLSRADPPTAIFAGSDEMAAGALMVAHRRGLAIPGDIAIAGFGDDALASYVWPPLTTMRQPVRELAWNAADLLLGDADADEQRELPHALVVRAST
ncbi:MAG: LacI family DNA-binding transcriptional regulator [Pseudomonadota bacterium]|nr:LacI family DNA-binding transcriptional regulator [Pseudomonadota bacterium]